MTPSCLRLSSALRNLERSSIKSRSQHGCVATSVAIVQTSWHGCRNQTSEPPAVRDATGFDREMRIVTVIRHIVRHTPLGRDACRGIKAGGRSVGHVEVAHVPAAQSGRPRDRGSCQARSYQHGLSAIEVQRKTREALAGQRQREGATLADLKAERTATVAKGRRIETEAVPIRYVAELIGGRVPTFGVTGRTEYSRL